MLTLCPHCGHPLPDRITDGIGLCPRCEQLISTTDANVLLSAGWYIRKYQGYDTARLRDEACITDEQARFVYEQVCENDLSHEEFVKAVKKYTSS